MRTVSPGATPRSSAPSALKMRAALAMLAAGCATGPRPTIGEDAVATGPLGDASVDAVLAGLEQAMVGIELAPGNAPNYGLIACLSVQTLWTVERTDHLDTIVDSVSHHAGTGCVNTTSPGSSMGEVPACH